MIKNWSEIQLLLFSRNCDLMHAEIFRKVKKIIVYNYLNSFLYNLLLSSFNLIQRFSPQIWNEKMIFH